MNKYNEFEIMDMMKEIEYGWLDRNNIKHYEEYELFSNNYILQTPKEVLENKIGVCWDQVEFERYYFENNNYNIKTYFIVHYDDDKCPTHTFLTFEKDNKYYWFEHSWERFRGIHEYNSNQELLFDIKDKFVKYEIDNDYNESNIVLYEYSKPTYHISVQEFYKYCESGIKINIGNL